MIPTENVESDFEIISKETTKELASKNLDDEKKPETEDKTSEPTERKKSIVDISVIKEAGESDNTIKTDLQESVSAMPGMTKSVSQEIIKRTDDTELKQIAQDLAEEDEKEKEVEEGSVIDISVVEEITDKEDDI